MPFQNDPATNRVDRVRLLTGDTLNHDIVYEDPVYEFVLSKYDSDPESLAESKSAIEILRMILAKFASYVTEKAGGLFVKDSDRYNHFKDLYDTLTKDPTNSVLGVGQGFTGGISNSAARTNRRDSDVRLNPLRINRNISAGGRPNPYYYDRYDRDY